MISIEKNWTCSEFWVINTDNNEYGSQLLGIILFNCLSSVVTFILNSVCFLTIWRLETLPNGTQLILLNLCVADLLTGTVSQPIYIIFLSLQKSGLTSCLLAAVSTSINLGLASASLSLLVVASTERYFSLFCPFWYEQFIIGWKPKLMAIIIWIYAVMTASLYSVKSIKRPVFMTTMIFFCLGCVWIGFVYTKVLHFAFKVRNRVTKEEKTYHLARDNQHAFKSITGFLVIVCIVCYSPHFITNYYDFFSSKQTDQLVMNWTWTLVLANSFINPICYCIKNVEIRKGVLKLTRIQKLFCGKYCVN